MYIVPCLVGDRLIRAPNPPKINKSDQPDQEKTSYDGSSYFFAQGNVVCWL